MSSDSGVFKEYRGLTFYSGQAWCCKHSRVRWITAWSVFAARTLVVGIRLCHETLPLIPYWESGGTLGNHKLSKRERPQREVKPRKVTCVTAHLVPRANVCLSSWPSWPRLCPFVLGSPDTAGRIRCGSDAVALPLPQVSCLSFQQSLGTSLVLPCSCLMKRASCVLCLGLNLDGVEIISQAKLTSRMSPTGRL